MTQEQEKIKALNIIDEYIKKEGENTIGMWSHPKDKYSWTWKQIRESIANGTKLEGAGDDLIYDVISMDIWEKENYD